MAYNDFTLAKLRQRFGLTIRDVKDLFEGVAEVPLPPVLATNLDRQIPLAVAATTEKAKSELIVSPMLVEVRFQAQGRVNLFSGVDFSVDPTTGLNGRCDFLLARGPSVLDVVAPVCMLVEAKNDDFLGGVPQALAEMVAAQRYNAEAGSPIDPIFGVVTSGLEWLFLRLDGSVATVGLTRHPIEHAGRIYAILRAMALGEVPA